MNRASKICAAVALCVAFTATAEEPRYKPFVLVTRGPGDVEKVVEEVKAKLAAAGFELVGSYRPYEGAVILAVTSEELKSAASKQEFGGYAAAQRVTVTKVGDEVQVAYTNPIYMGHAYRLSADLAPIASRLASALGKGEEYGPPEGLTAKDLRGYHYMFRMQYFDDPSRLGKFESRAAAIEAIEAGLAAARGGATKVYRIDLPGGKETVFGVALTDGCSGDAHIMKEIDFKPLRSTGHLPYEVLVSGSSVYALYGRFRIAVNFTDLKMMGSHSFMNIRCAPDAIEQALEKVVAAKDRS
jgi:hypothetical protein